MKRAVLLAVVVLAGCGSTRVVTQAPAPGHLLARVPASEDGSAQAYRCGVERWSIKTLQDPGAAQVNLTAQDTSVDALRAFRAPVDPTDRVPPVETATWRLTGVQMGASKQEADGDIHLVVGTGTDTLIVEFPHDGCYPLASSGVAQKIHAARQAFESACGVPGPTYAPSRCHTATIEGVGFYDRIHGQRGVAPSGIELHPVLSFERLS